MKSVRSRHDEFFKNMMRYPAIAEDFFKQHLPANVLASLNLSSLKIENGSFVDETLSKYESDILFSVKRIDSDQKAFLYLLAEHQSESDELMPFRLISYMIQFLKLHVKQHKRHPLPLPLIYSVVVYNGKAIWSYDRDFFSLFGDFSALARKTFFEPSAFIDVCRLDEAALSTKHLSNLMLASLRLAQNRKALEKKVELLSDLFLKCGLKHSSELVRAVLEYNTVISIETDDKTSTPYWAVFIERIAPEYQEVIMNLGELTRKEGFQQGLQQGIEQNREAIAANMIRAGVEFGFISEMTGIAIPVLRKIEHDLKVL
ncbi:MAG: Ytl2 [Gammaproteobacteria bacterium]|jgi:predicted transposase/invertase (TIGR01784 family)|nr:Ytl2 [Gammaproteobacteria bacterium]